MFSCHKRVKKWLMIKDNATKQTIVLKLLNHSKIFHNKHSHDKNCSYLDNFTVSSTNNKEQVEHKQLHKISIIKITNNLVWRTTTKKKNVDWHYLIRQSLHLLIYIVSEFVWIIKCVHKILRNCKFGCCFEIWSTYAEMQWQQENICFR